MYLLFGKRCMDFVASSIGIICLSPLLIVVSALIKITSKGPVFFIQERIGLGSKSFNMIKFRSMLVNNTDQHSLVTVSGDSRITTVGRFLRRYKLDELPQLLNVIRGDMALVGPRPEVLRYIKHFQDDYDEILKIRPGITDNAAITYKNEEKILAKYDDAEDAYIRIILPKKIDLYKQYLNNIGFFNDLKLIFKTIF